MIDHPAHGSFLAADQTFANDIDSMIIRDDENPYLRGKPAKAHINIELSQGEDLFGDLTGKARAKAVEKFRKSHEKNFSNSLNELKRICKRCNFFQFLAHFGYYDQLILDGEKADAAYAPVEQCAVELLQALVLQVSQHDINRCLTHSPQPKTLVRANKLLGGINASFGLKRVGLPTPASKGQRILSEMIRSHTVSMRNAGYPSQILGTVNGLANSIDDCLQIKYGITLTNVTKMLENIRTLIEKRINDDFLVRKNVFSVKERNIIVDKFLMLYPHDEKRHANFRKDVEQANMSLRDLGFYLTTLLDEGNYKLFYLSTSEWMDAYPGTVSQESIEWILSNWSLELGCLSDDNAEHFFLDNPIWGKPLIRISADRFFLPLPGMIQSFMQRMMESLVQTEPKTWEKFQSKTRSNYLEKVTADLFEHNFPSATIYRGITWIDPATKQQFETDMLVLVGSHALIVECKAGRISSLARRGDTIRLERDVQKFIGDPTLQGQRFASFLVESHGVAIVEDKARNYYVIDVNKILRITRINVTLDYFGPVGIQARMLREAGMISKDLEPAATFHIHELENVLEILDRPNLSLHYLHRRAEIEASNDVLTNELSLLATYLATGFDFGDFEGDETTSLIIPTMGTELDPYFMSKELRRPIKKPRRRFTTWWNDMLTELPRRATPFWMECSYALLSVGYKRQREFEELVEEMLKEVATKWQNPEHLNTCIMLPSLVKRRFTIMCVGVKAVTLNEARETVQRAINLADERHSTPETLVILRSLSSMVYPYDAMYLFRAE